MFYSPSWHCATVSEEKELKIVAVVGSTTQKGHTHALVKHIADEISRLGVHVDIVDLSTANIPIYGFDENGEGDLPDIKAKLQRADGILLGSPEYHGSYTGVLKNLLDHCYLDEFARKPVALCGVAGGDVGAVNTLNALRIVCRWVHSFVIPHQVSIPNSKRNIKDGKLVEEKHRKRADQLAKELVKFVRVFSLPEVRAIFEE